MNIKSEPTLEPLPRLFYEQPSTIVAQSLLGKMLVRRYEDVLLSGVIVEVEAYLPENDPAAHNFIGKTARNSVLFGEAGHAYVHGMRQYHLIDIVTEGNNVPGSVLIRALEPRSGVEKMQELRKAENIFKLTSGPGRLCQALHIDRSLNGCDVTTSKSPLVITNSESTSPLAIEITPRVGISRATDSLLRFYIKGNTHVSSPR